MILSSLLIVVGFVILIKGADWLVDGASALAKKFNIPDLAIGLTIVAFGTSAPELVVNTVSSFQNHPEIVFGNVIGSNNFNLFFILGIVGLILPINVQSSTVWKEIPISFFAVVILFFLTNGILLADDGMLSRIDGFILMICFILFLYYIYRQMQSEPANDVVNLNPMSNLKMTLFIVGGLTGLVLGGKIVVDNAISVAENLGISEKIIGLTIIAAGTSLPELMTSVVAALKKNSDIAIGNIIGSNIFNIFLILSVSSIINPIPYNFAFNTDLYFLMAGTAFLFAAMFIHTKKTIDRWQSLLLVLAFVAYTSFLIAKEI